MQCPPPGEEPGRRSPRNRQEPPLPLRATPGIGRRPNRPLAPRDHPQPGPEPPPDRRAAPSSGLLAGRGRALLLEQRPVGAARALHHLTGLGSPGRCCRPGARQMLDLAADLATRLDLDLAVADLALDAARWSGWSGARAPSASPSKRPPMTALSISAVPLKKPVSAISMARLSVSEPRRGLRRTSRSQDCDLAGQDDLRADCQFLLVALHPVGLARGLGARHRVQAAAAASARSLRAWDMPLAPERRGRARLRSPLRAKVGAGSDVGLLGCCRARGAHLLSCGANIGIPLSLRGSNGLPVAWSSRYRFFRHGPDRAPADAGTTRPSASSRRRQAPAPAGFTQRQRRENATTRLRQEHRSLTPAFAIAHGHCAPFRAGAGPPSRNTPGREDNRSSRRRPKIYDRHQIQRQARPD